MSNVHEEAERRYPLYNDLATRANAVARQIFVDGSEWQAEQPVTITDKMIVRGANTGWVSLLRGLNTTMTSSKDHIEDGHSTTIRLQRRLRECGRHRLGKVL